MKNLKIRNSLIVLTSLAFTLTLVTPKPFHKNQSKYTINQECTTYGPFAKCSSGNVYIGDELEINYIKENVDQNGIYVVDERSNKDSNMKIISSANIKDKNKMNDLLEILIEYEKIYPSNWNRTISSMMNEWEIHNLCSSASIASYRTNDVDLNNEDEKLYKSKILTKILNN